MDMINKHGHRISVTVGTNDRWCKVYDCDRGYSYYELTEVIFKKYTFIV